MGRVHISPIWIEMSHFLVSLWKIDLFTLLACCMQEGDGGTSSEICPAVKVTKQASQHKCSYCKVGKPSHNKGAWKRNNSTDRKCPGTELGHHWARQPWGPAALLTWKELFLCLWPNPPQWTRSAPATAVAAQTRPRTYSGRLHSRTAVLMPPPHVLEQVPK